MATVDITSPSGMVLTIRGLKGKELDDFANRQTNKRKNITLRMCAACTTSVKDPGPYDLQEDLSLDWTEVLVGDLSYAIIAIRQATFRDTRDEVFTFKQACPSCEHKFEWGVDLLELEKKEWSKSDRERYKTNPTYECKLMLSGYGDSVDGTYTVSHRLLTGADQGKKRPKGKEDSVVYGVAERLVEVRRPNGETISKSDVYSWLGELDLSDLDSLAEMMDEVDCGVDTTLLIECPACEEEWHVELPFESFWRKRRY